MKMKINYQIKEKHIMKKKDFLLAKSKLNQQNRKSHTQLKKDLNNEVEELTRTMETLLLKTEQFYNIK